MSGGSVLLWTYEEGEKPENAKATLIGIHKGQNKLDKKNYGVIFMSKEELDKMFGN